ncbi:hypothetical protein LSCM1_02482 [Leishmania martiniquensis]|uniref:Centrosomal protein CEP104 N-terminal domain-containing protein n=1 Tax=Leishmania martiniquensis TaxID=1580590 RepID=A0A836KE74_9TRYP|nr:hypothetical protein LSCM1_02482 [Leishmania martiniquensis]
MSVALPYDVLFCTSEDPHHPVSELGGCTGHLKPGSPIPTGWQSARHGKTPQTLVIRFHGNVWLQQLRILSHEAKIATKVEVRVAKLTDDDDWNNPPSFRNVRFVKLGSVDFNSNEQSHFKSKERKTVHLKTEAYFLKLLFDRPFINAYNSGHQVGIYSLECSGYLIEPVPFHADRIAGARSPSRRSSSATSPTARAAAQRKTSGAPPALVSLDGHRAPPAVSVDESTDKPIPLATLTPPASAHSSSTDRAPSYAAPSGAFRSVRILEFEDFFLRRSEELVSLKEEAVALEDYHVAAECRDKLALLNDWAREIYELEQDKVQAIIDEDFGVAQQVKIRMDTLIDQLFAQTMLPSPEAAMPSAQGDDLVPDVESSARREASFSPTPVSMAAAPHVDDAESNEYGAVEVNEEVEQMINMDTLEPHEKAVARAIVSCAGGEVASVALVNRGFDLQPLIAAIGSFAVACLFSRRFKLREAALLVLTEQMDLLQSPAQAVEDTLLRFLDLNAYGLQDSIPNVVFAACGFVRMCLADAAKCISGVLSPLVALLPRLVTRCSDNLQRIREEALSTLALYVRTPAIPTNSILSVTLMEPIDKERRNLPLGNPKAQLARLSLLQMLVENGRLPTDGAGINSQQVLHKLLLPTVNHPHPEVRDLAVSILRKLIASRQLVVREKDLAKVMHASIRESITSKR